MRERYVFGEVVPYSFKMRFTSSLSLEKLLKREVTELTRPNTHSDSVHCLNPAQEAIKTFLAMAGPPCTSIT